MITGSRLLIWALFALLCAAIYLLIAGSKENSRLYNALVEARKRILALEPRRPAFELVPGELGDITEVTSARIPNSKGRRLSVSEKLESALAVNRGLAADLIILTSDYRLFTEGGGI